MPYWWEHKAAERFWVEIRWVEDIGRELECGLVDEDGRRNGYYDLVATVEPGDIVYHWHARQHRFVGRSVVAKRPVTTHESHTVALRGFRPLLAEVNLENIRAHEAELIRVRDRLGAAHPKQTLYLPFQYRSDGLRMLSNYFAKLPVEVVTLFFGKDGFAEAGAADPDPEDGPAIEGETMGAGRLAFLDPFRPKADTDYNATVGGGVQKRGRTHETLVNDFAEWLTKRGHSVGCNAVIDLGTSGIL